MKRHARNSSLATRCLAPALAAMPLAAFAAHEHGVAQLDVALDGSHARAMLDGAADNFTGFERAPADETQREQIHLVHNTLARLPELVVLTPGCSGGTAQVTEPASMRDAEEDRDEHPRETHEHDDEHSHQTHANWQATADYACDAATPPTHLDATALFASFPRLSQLRLQWFGPNGQTGAVLTADAPSLALP